MKRPAKRVTALIVALTFTLAAQACSDTAAPADAPEGHTVVKSGVPHASGLSNPLQNCTSCHGANLQGGTDGQPSCTSCHGVKW